MFLRYSTCPNNQHKKSSYLDKSKKKIMVMIILDDYTEVPRKTCFERGHDFYYSFLNASIACSSDNSCVGVIMDAYMAYFTCLGGIKETSNLTDTKTTYQKSERFSKLSLGIHFDITYCLLFSL